MSSGGFSVRRLIAALVHQPLGKSALLVCEVEPVFVEAGIQVVEDLDLRRIPVELRTLVQSALQRHQLHNPVEPRRKTLQVTRFELHQRVFPQVENLRRSGHDAVEADRCGKAAGIVEKALLQLNSSQARAGRQFDARSAEWGRG